MRAHVVATYGSLAAASAAEGALALTASVKGKRRFSLARLAAVVRG